MASNQTAVKGSSRKPVEQPAGFGLSDLYYTLFRHWRMIAGSLLAGVAIAAGAFFYFKPIYTSEAKLWVKFVSEKRSIGPGPTAPDSVTLSPDRSGDNIMNSELEIFRSFDLALQVADAFGAERILAKAGGGTNRLVAASVIKSGLVVDNPKRTGIILVSFSHPDPEIVQPVLNRLLEAYLNKHEEIHHNSGVFDELQKRQREALRMSLSQTESDLLEIQTNSGIISVEESKRALTDQVIKLSDQLITAETELAEAKAALTFLTGTQAVLTATAEAHSSNPVTNTNLPPALIPATPAVPPDKLDSYRALVAELEVMRKHEHELLKQYTEAHPSVKRLHALVTETARQVAQFETDYPTIRSVMSPVSTSLLGASLPATRQTQTPEVASAVSAAEAANREYARVSALQAKIATLKNHLEQARQSAAELAKIDKKMTDLRRTKDLQEAKFKYYQSNLDQAVVDEAVGPGKVANISMVQSPAVAVMDSHTRDKMVLIGFAAPWLLGIVLAFLLDLFLDQSIKRASEVEKKVGVPLFISIPERKELSRHRQPILIGNASQGSSEAPAATRLPAETTSSKKSSVELELDRYLATNDSQALQPLFDTLRDRLVAFFDAQQLTHKPKLLGITGCHAEAGVTTVVAGLAASLSNSGDGNVLVVDMKDDAGAVQHFFRGKPQLGLMDVLDEARRSEAQVQENLYVVGEQELGGGQLSRILHKRFQGLLPKLKLSSYDYILFDLPPMSQTSIAPRVARFMDMVLVVAESEKTNAELLRQSANLLSESGTHVGAVLNRSRQYVPQGLSQELP